MKVGMNGSAVVFLVLLCRGAEKNGLLSDLIEFLVVLECAAFVALRMEVAVEDVCADGKDVVIRDASEGVAVALEWIPIT